MIPTEVIVRPVPFQKQAQRVFILGQRPGTARQGRNVLAQRQINPFDIGGHDASRQTKRAERGAELGPRATDGQGIIDLSLYPTLTVCS